MVVGLVDVVEKAGLLRDRFFGEITYCRNVFVPVTNVCRNSCGYCGFCGGEYYLMSPSEVYDVLVEGVRGGAVEALFTFGERPEEAGCGFSRILGEYGYGSFTDYLVDLFEMALDLGLLPHTNPGLVSKSDFKLYSRYNASMGLMLESTATLPVHEGCPGKAPEKRIELIEFAGQEKIPLTTGILVGVGETWLDRLKSLRKIKEIDDRYGHIQEVIIQGHNKHRLAETQHPSVDEEVVVKTIAIARHILKDIEIQAPPNLHPDIKPLLTAGISDLGGISTTKDHINPSKEWPTPNQLKEKIDQHGYILKERLPIYPEYIEKGWVSKHVKKNLDKNNEI
ncbi:Thiamine biosynthesis enzyme ThiH, FO synthase [Methanonatronarchaeum thermophilum]|uniref:7,8-didemethyl-8-hydroxy-5-deazariboflavin synthase n=1 Tax=Methanonatronarchaeum thermophilum TaxID=1927129 RepID=A0A1Y3G9P2_9EURY|nr:7,8-didemethyl-8-hydroxy-5-deazariboflavin synthase subunit CofG [Methanonatronarchaeum thermophilum]OUJ18119.1 Thiamine biosynthesis enzyme ThiH, FO synthase [Methanonatronarchaeum thermophilum]